MYIYQTKIHLHDTDAAGRLFFANQFKIVHDAYESLLETIGFGFAEIIRESDFFLPIVHAESDYKKSLFVGDLIEVQVTVAKIGHTSFMFSYKIINSNQELVGTAKTVHVTVSDKTGEKIPLPELLREKVRSLYAEDK
ncbi:MAG: 1,4-dihydroxy-2-naphthoyl-CoA hydrolase [Candidatus Omnitrophota bacterium]|jgi:1,4-dihydroxy-2-naphthoyl-CoA hydrolase